LNRKDDWRLVRSANAVASFVVLRCEIGVLGEMCMLSPRHSALLGLSFASLTLVSCAAILIAGSADPAKAPANISPAIISPANISPTDISPATPVSQVTPVSQITPIAVGQITTQQPSVSMAK
jgi:hypothetical protein